MTDELNELMVKLPHGRSLSIADLLNGWRQHVHRLETEASQPPADTDWGAHDLIAALTLRDFISGGTDELTARQRSLVAEQLAPVDEEYKRFTEYDAARAVRTFAERPLSDSRWWWDRVPRSGLAREEILR